MVAPVIRVAGAVGLWAAAMLAGCGQPSAPAPAPGVGSGAQDTQPTPRGTARALPAACTDGTLGQVARPSLPGPGVTADPREPDAIRGEADAWTLPAEVTFTLAAPAIEDRQIVLRGELANPTPTPQPVFLTEAGAGFFHATLIGGVVRRSAPPPPAGGPTPPPKLFPEPRRFELAPAARWPFEVAIELACWELAPAQTVTAHWWFATSGPGLQGDVAVTLP